MTEQLIGPSLAPRPSSAADAERALLGAVLSGYKGMADLALVVQGRDFAQPVHEAIWEAALRVYGAGNDPDPVQVRAALGESQKMLPGGPIYLHDLMQAGMNFAAARSYAEEVASAAGRRRLKNAAIAINQLAESERDLGEITEDARQRLDEATQTSTREGAITVGDALPEVLDVAQSGGVRGLATPWPDLDRIIKGIAPGRFIVIGGRPGGGKSIAGLNLATHVAKWTGHGVYFASMEMPKEELTRRLIASEAGVDLNALEYGNLSERQWEKIRDATPGITALPLHIQDRSHQTIAEIRSEVRDISRRHTMALVVVDYIQLLKARDPKMMREQQIAEFTRGLKLLSREQNVCVVGLSQLNRGSLQRTDKRPTMNDLRESGAIENDADVVILLHRPEEETPDIEVIVAKQRNGPLGECRLQLAGHVAQLRSTTRSN